MLYMFIYSLIGVGVGLSVYQYAKSDPMGGGAEIQNIGDLIFFYALIFLWPAFLVLVLGMRIYEEYQKQKKA